MKKILITGHKGVVGQVLLAHLKSEYEITGFDIPEKDVTDMDMLKIQVKGFDAIIHLAMDPVVGFMNENYNPGDLTMVYNIYKVATDNKIPRVIMFSSIHADEYKLDSSVLKTTHTIPSPDSPYGAYKVYMEALGRFYAKKGLEVIIVRLGGVTKDDSMEEEEGFEKVYLSHKDLVSMVRQMIEVAEIKGNYELFYGVSNNQRRVHDNSNNIGWIPTTSTPV